MRGVRPEMRGLLLGIALTACRAAQDSHSFVGAPTDAGAPRKEATQTDAGDGGPLAVAPPTTSSDAAPPIDRLDGDVAEMGRITCGLLEKYGPSRSYHDLDVVIPDSPYGRLIATMGPTRKLLVEVSGKSQADQPQARQWLAEQLPSKPTSCTFLLAAPAWLARVGYPDVPAMVPEEAYVPIQLDLARKAAAVDPEKAWRWLDGALAAFRGLDVNARRKFERDPELHAAAYALVDQPAPNGLSDVGKRGYCQLYDSVRSMFPPRATRERQSLEKARRALGCR